MVCLVITFELTLAFQTAASQNLCATSMIPFESFWCFLVFVQLLTIPSTLLTVHHSFWQKTYDRRDNKVN